MGLAFQHFFKIILILSLYISYLHSASVDIQQRKYREVPQVQYASLYNASDEVEELTANNFDQNVYNSNRAWLVEFYNTWCGHCQRYAPTYKGVANYFKHSKDLFVVAAVDCANDINQPLCRYFDIMGYPTLRYFHENFLKGIKNFGVTVDKPSVSNVDENVKTVINTLVSEQKENRAQMLPNLLPYEHNDAFKIFDSVKPEIKYGFLILESDKSILGVDAALTFHNVSSISVRYSEHNEELSSSLEIKEFPALVILNREGSKVEEKIPRIEHAKRYIAAFLKQRDINVDKYIVIHNKKEILEAVKNVGQENLVSKVKEVGDAVFQMDLESTLRVSLGREVARNKVIDGEKLNALRAYLKVLIKYFPLGKRGYFFLNDLLSTVTNTESVSGADLYKLVKDSEKPEQLIWSSPKEWLGCIGSTPAHRRYPCGLWTMFHYLTVQAAERNAGKKEANPKEVLNAMYGYIKYFFGCSDCSQHFQAMAAERNMDKVSSLRDSVMWLWAAHNVVNKRLAGDSTEDPEFPKKQFPTAERCPECRYSNETFKEQQVEKYLRHVYSSINVRYMGSDLGILHMGLEKLTGTSGGGVFTSIDSIIRWLPVAYLGYIYARH
ncbi:hypothetical protein HHI36_020926 [Cryptolaemus montrouzieri]|uniref:Sulfhydryl oxidase n=1 Tax=Cryptolaemus montrouzieri TaxID=559131 RepID=A0ABD2NBT0_9CUCU